MQIDTAVSEADVGLLKEGMEAQFTVDAFPGKTFKGKVRQVRNAPTTTQGVVTYDAVIDVDNSEKSLRPGMTANVTFVLAHVSDAVKIPNSALRFKPTRDQMVAIRGEGSGGRGSNRRNGRGSGSAGSSAGSGGSASPFAPSGGSAPPWMGGEGGMRMRDFGDKKPVWKLVDGKPKMVLIKPGLTDGSTTEMVEGDLQPGDQLVTEISGVAKTNTRRTGAF
jgi:HlyD family secretion protein